MRRLSLWLIAAFCLTFVLVIGSSGTTSGSQTGPSDITMPAELAGCKDFAFSTEEDFRTNGPLPPDGNAIISDGDLLSRTGAVCVRNRDLLKPWEVQLDLGLDGADVLSVEAGLVSFSTELDDPGGRFTAGDLLNTWGGAIPNQALLIRFQVTGDRGLDAIQWVGQMSNIIAFHNFARTVSREQWLGNPGLLPTELQRYNVDVWFSIEGTERQAAVMPIYDGDLLSAAQGVIVYRNSDLLAPSVPAGIPDRGVDYGLDAFAAPRTNATGEAYFSTEILNNGEPIFTDGDVLKLANGIVVLNKDMIVPFEPSADFLGLDALSINFNTQQSQGFLPRVLNFFRELVE